MVYIKALVAGISAAFVISLVSTLVMAQKQPIIDIGWVKPIKVEHQELKMKPYKQKKLVSRKNVPNANNNAAAVNSEGLASKWQRIGHCESTNNYKAINPNGKYFGRWQFDQTTWNSNAAAAGRNDLVGVRPDNASPKDQDLVRDETYSRRGFQPWECAFKLGIR